MTSCDRQQETQLSDRQQNILDLVARKIAVKGKTEAARRAASATHMELMGGLKKLEELEASLDKQREAVRKDRYAAEKKLEQERDRLKISACLNYDRNDQKYTTAYNVTDKTGEFATPPSVKQDLMRARRLRLIGKGKEASVIEQAIVDKYKLTD